MKALTAYVRCPRCQTVAAIDQDQPNWVGPDRVVVNPHPVRNRPATCAGALAPRSLVRSSKHMASGARE